MLQQKVCDEVIEFMGSNVLAILNSLRNSEEIMTNDYRSIGLEMSVVNENYWYPFNTLLHAFDLILDRKSDGWSAWNYSACILYLHSR